jgi:pyrrolidone-carboxylate peptidase
MRHLPRRWRACVRALVWLIGGLTALSAPVAAARETGAAPDDVQLQSKVKTVELTVEEARLERLAATDIPYHVLSESVTLSGTDPAALAELGDLLWQAAVRGVQSGEIWDDRALYWARLKFTSELRGVADETALAVMERASRGMNDVAFPDDLAARVVVTGFDPFHLDRQIDQSNPSGLAALALDGRTLPTANGPAHIQAAVFPVRFADFDAGMVEAFIEPLLEEGLEDGVDLVVTLSMGRDGFDLERFPGRRRSSPVTDNLNVLTGADPENPLIPGQPDGGLSGPEFLEFTLPADAMVAVGGDFPVRDNRKVATLERGDLEAPSLQALDGQTAVRGSGGGYLSNEIAYRTLLANGRKYGSKCRIPMGHLHTPRLAGFDPEFERKVVAQIESMLIAAVEALVDR